jgi:hypothetical protein
MNWRRQTPGVIQMTTLTVRADIDEDGKLRLEVPCQLPPGPVEVVLVVQSTSSDPSSNTSAQRSGRSGLFLGKGPQGVDLDGITEEMNAEWKKKLADLEP